MRQNITRCRYAICAMRMIPLFSPRCHYAAMSVLLFRLPIQIQCCRHADDFRAMLSMMPPPLYAMLRLPLITLQWLDAYAFFAAVPFSGCRFASCHFRCFDDATCRLFYAAIARLIISSCRLPDGVVATTARLMFTSMPPPPTPFHSPRHRHSLPALRRY